MCDLVERDRRRALIAVSVQVQELRAKCSGVEQEVARQVEQARVGSLRVRKSGEPVLVAVAEGGTIEEIP